MGFFFDKVKYFVIEKAVTVVSWLSEKLTRTTYDDTNISNHVDVDAVLAEFRERIKEQANEAEKDCMNSIAVLFFDLTGTAETKFPDLTEIIRSEQQKAEMKLQGTVMKYVKAHLSKNDPEFLNVLKMKPGNAKKEALDATMNKILHDAENTFYSKLKKYVEHIMKEFSDRLNIRLSSQETQLNMQIKELEKWQQEAKNGQMDISKLKDRSASLMEASQCIIQMLEMEM